MELARVTDLTAPPVVGEFYLVPTVRYQWFEFVANWPVFPSFHEDKEHLNFPWPHYHVDPRFVAPDVAEKVVRWQFGEGDIATISQRVPLNRITKEALYNRDFQLARHNISLAQAEANTVPHPDIVWRRRQCHRDLVYSHPHANAIRQLGEAFRGRQCPKNKTGWVCPHKSYPLGSVAADPQGVITCPLHGLRIDAASGEVLGPAPGFLDIP